MKTKKANWIDDNTAYTTYKCSNCGKEPMYSANREIGKAFVTLTTYCPHCGCKMGYDGEEL